MTPTYKARENEPAYMDMETQRMVRLEGGVVLIAYKCLRCGHIVSVKTGFPAPTCTKCSKKGWNYDEQ